MIIKDAGEIKLRDVYGRESYNGSAKHNVINIENTKISDAYLYGGYLNKYSANNSSDANHNTITITKNSTINGRVYGGYYASGLVKENTVNIDTSTVNDIIYGRYTENGLVVENSVNIDNSTISKNVYGRYSRTSGEINENKIKVTSNSTILGDIYGGRSGNGKVTANEVKLINSTASENIYGGYSKNSKANQNKVFFD